MNVVNIYLFFSDNKVAIKLIIIGLLISLIFNGIIQNILLNAFLMIYLSLKSINIIKSINNNFENFMLIKILKQWVCCSFLIILDYFLSFIFGFFMTIFYNIFKIFIIIIFLQNNEEFIVIFYNIILSFYNNNELKLKKIFEYLEIKAKFIRNSTKNDFDIYRHFNNYYKKVLLLISGKQDI